jgi:FkbM family methyltransferase
MQPSTKQAIKRWLRRAGLEAARYVRFRNFDERLISFLHTHRVDLVLDIGASSGQYGQRLRGLGYRKRIVSFEPLDAPRQRLLAAARRDPLWEVGPRCAIGERNGTVEIHVSRNWESSSVLTMLPAHLAAAPQSEAVGVAQVEMRTIDSCAAEFLRQGEVVFAKMDVQGTEDKVLTGATQILAQAVGLQVELSLTPLYAGQPLLCEMITMLTRAGFDLVDVEPAFIDPRDGRVLQLDGIFAAHRSKTLA